MNDNVRIAYDRLAADYDRMNRVDQRVRDMLWFDYERIFFAGNRILDVGCGTGRDALRLLRMGCSVTAIDVSQGMLTRLTEQWNERDRLITRRMKAEDIGRLPSKSFDGIVSGFGALNTVQNLSLFAENGANLLRPGGRMLLHFVGPASLWEWLYLVRRARLAELVRFGRMPEREFSIGGVLVEHHLRRPKSMYRHYFESRFELVDCYALGALRPPPNVHVSDLLERILERLERAFRRHWPVVNLGRFYVLHLKRRTRRVEGQTQTAEARGM